MTRITAHIRFPAVAALLAIALAAGTASAAGAADSTAGATSAGHAAAATCPGAMSRILGAVVNDTSEPMHLVRAEHGITNMWCTRPGDVPAHGFSGFLAQDAFFQTSVVILYRFPHEQTTVKFLAHILLVPAHGVDIGCEVRGKVLYRCEGILTKFVNFRFAEITFKVLPPKP